MKSIGIDSVEITRFHDWHKKDPVWLKRIFHPTEIEYCLAQPALSAQRFAVRYAAKEALFKALSSQNIQTPGLFFICSHSQITLTPAPQLLVEWNALHIPAQTVHVSLTHTLTTATAVVILL